MTGRLRVDALAGGIFINYRGDDSGSLSELLERDLVDAFGRARVFLDCYSISPGDDYVEVLVDRVRGCRVLLVVIGSKWLTLRAGDGSRRIDDPTDWVRREIVEALTAGLRVVPVLVDDAAPPTEGQLPEDIRALARCQAVRVRHRHSRSDIAELIRGLIAAEPTLGSALATTGSLEGALNSIACGRPLDYLDEMLGRPLRTGVMRDGVAPRQYRVYRDTHVIVTVTAAGEGMPVDAFSVTVRDANFHFATGKLTADLLDVDLAEANFAMVDGSAEGRRLIVGANRIGYTEAFYYGNPGYYQSYLLSYNGAADGDFCYVEGRHEFSSGSLIVPWVDGDLPSAPDGSWYDEFRAGTRINTVSVLHSSAPLNALMTNHAVGIDRSEVDHIPE